MNLAEQLKERAEEKIVNHVIEFYEEIETQMIESANQGYKGFRVSVDQRSDFHILTDERFLNNLRVLLDGCKVEILKKERTNLLFKNKYYTHELRVGW